LARFVFEHLRLRAVSVLGCLPPHRALDRDEPLLAPAKVDKWSAKGPAPGIETSRCFAPAKVDKQTAKGLHTVLVLLLAIARAESEIGGAVARHDEGRIFRAFERLSGEGRDEGRRPWAYVTTRPRW
jgi:hypothetical protein